MNFLLFILVLFYISFFGFFLLSFIMIGLEWRVSNETVSNYTL